MSLLQQQPEIDKYITEVAAEKAEDAWVAEQEAAVAAAARAAAAANTEANAEANMSCTIKSSIPCKLFRPDRLKTLLEELFPERGVRVEIHYNVYIIEAPRKVFLVSNDHGIRNAPYTCTLLC